MAVIRRDVIHREDWLDYSRNAGVAKLADALDLGSSVRKDVWVQVPPSAPKEKTREYRVFFYLGVSTGSFEAGLRLASD